MTPDSQNPGGVWFAVLRQGFPQLRGNGIRRDVFDLNCLRNRIAHHEPVNELALPEAHEAALLVAAWILSSDEPLRASSGDSGQKC